MTDCQEAPYDELDSNDLLQAIEDGYRLHRPTDCPPALYQQVLEPCWKLEPHERPSFSELQNRIQAIYNSGMLDEPAPSEAVSPRRNSNVRYVDVNEQASVAHRPNYENIELRPEPRKNSILLASRSAYYQ